MTTKKVKKMAFGGMAAPNARAAAALGAQNQAAQAAMQGRPTGLGGGTGLGLGAMATPQTQSQMQSQAAMRAAPPPPMTQSAMRRPGMKKGGSVSSASKRADGCCVKGKTKGRMV